MYGQCDKLSALLGLEEIWTRRESLNCSKLGGSSRVGSSASGGAERRAKIYWQADTMGSPTKPSQLQIVNEAWLNRRASQPASQQMLGGREGSSVC